LANLTKLKELALINFKGFPRLNKFGFLNLVDWPKILPKFPGKEEGQPEGKEGN